MKKMIIASGLALGLIFSGTASAGEVVSQNEDSKLELSALFFLNLTAKKTDQNGTTTADSMGLAVDRAYLTAKYHFDDAWMMRLTLDTLYNAAATGKKSEVFLKNAYLQGKFSDAVGIDIGLINTPWIGYEQGLWKHRYVSKVYIDTQGFGHSADAGVGVFGKLADGMFAYHISEVNGGGYGNVAETKSLDLDARIGVYPLDGLTLDLQFRDGYKGGKTVATPAAPKHQLIQFMASYGSDAYRVGGNYIQNKQGSTIKDTGYVGWGWVKFGGDYSAFGRFESTKTKTGGANSNKETRYLAGLEYLYNKHVSMSLAFDSGKNDNLAGTVTKTTRYGLYTQAKF